VKFSLVKIFHSPFTICKVRKNAQNQWNCKNFSIHLFSFHQIVSLRVIIYENFFLFRFHFFLSFLLRFVEKNGSEILMGIFFMRFFSVTSIKHNCFACEKIFHPKSIMWKKEDIWKFSPKICLFKKNIEERERKRRKTQFFAFTRFKLNRISSYF
jgi:hypothetical protein